MFWFQTTFSLPAMPRGFHLVTDQVVAKLGDLRPCRVGLAHVFIQHSSASLTINENADPTVRDDFERHMNVMVPEDAPYYRHTYEGPDDMPAHIKASMMGAALTIPVRDGQLVLGTWQGIYLCEHRNHASGRTLTITAFGDMG